MYLRIYMTIIIVLWLLILKAHLIRGVIVENPRDTSVTEGEEASLQCKFTVPPKTTSQCAWLRDGLIVDFELYAEIYQWLGDPKRGNCGFKIVNASNARDDATWLCQLVASTTETSNSAKLTVYVQPTAPELQYENTTVINETKISISSSGSNVIRCMSQHGNPPPYLSWVYNKEVIVPKNAVSPENNSKKYSSAITFTKNFTKEDDGQILRCTVTHITLNESNLSAEIAFNYEYKTTTVTTPSPTYVVVDVGSGYAFECIADGNPPATCEWIFQKKNAPNWEVKSYSCLYTITAVTDEHQGQYMCMAGNANDAKLPTPEITLETRNKTKNVIAIVGGVVGVVLIIAVVVLAFVVFKLRKNVKKKNKTDKLPDMDSLNRSIKDPYQRATYMVPMPNEEAPLNPPPLPKNPPPSKRDTHIYAEPHYYHSILFPSEKRGEDVTDINENQDEEERYIDLNDDSDSKGSNRSTIPDQQPIIIGGLLKQPVNDSDDDK